MEVKNILPLDNIVLIEIQKTVFVQLQAAADWDEPAYSTGFGKRRERPLMIAVSSVV